MQENLLRVEDRSICVLSAVLRLGLRLRTASFGRCSSMNESGAMDARELKYEGFQVTGLREGGETVVGDLGGT